MGSSDDRVIKYWLLDLATEFPRSFGLLFPTVEGEALNVKEIPGRESEDYAEALVELFREGLIELKSDFPGDDVCSQSGVSKIVERFTRLPRGERQVRHVGSDSQTEGNHQSRHYVRFQLTAAGGQEWEKLAEPDWNHYFNQLGGRKSCEIISQNRDLVMAVLGWFQETDGGRVHLNAIQIQKLSDYPILYWKRLPSVFKVNFTFEKAEARWSGDGPAWLNEPKWFKEWRAAATHWYTKPWELAAWPSE